MHIPDGYLSPSTCAVLYAAAAPFWYVASQKVKRLVAGRFVPLISVFAAFSFVIMMFNIPLPGGTSGHAVGATLVSIVLGPWAAILAVSVALAIQALFFGDGGVLSFGANAFNMAIVMPLVSSFVYRAIVGSRSPGARRRVVGAAIAGYLALNAAALFTAVEFGIQPIFFRAADGAPLYAPYGLDVAIPAMMAGHLLVAGPVEALVTALAGAFLARTTPELLRLAESAPAAAGKRTNLRRLWAAIAALVVISPIGLLAVGTAWGEWSPADAADWPLPLVPEGLKGLSGLWSAPMPDYVVPLLGGGTEAQFVGYIGSAVVGVAILALIAYISSLVSGRANGKSGTSGPTGS
jgi:cobalt/nickel transport system permease protein